MGMEELLGPWSQNEFDHDLCDFASYINSALGLLI